MPGREPMHPRPRIERLWLKRLPWYEQPAWAALAPLALLYGAAAGARNAFWRMAKQRAELRTISVGNLTVGGNGKTPFTLFLARRLQARGFSTGIVSRGFGRRPHRERALLVSDGREVRLSPEEAGDEPVMLAKSFDGPVVVAKRRIDGMRLLAQTAHPDFAILDDAFQHVRLARDVDLLLVSRERGLGNGWLLPAGPMRERLSAAKRADAVIVMSSGAADAPCALAPRETAALARGRMLSAGLCAHSLVRAEQGRWTEFPPELAGRRVLAVSGLADSGGFYAMLRAIGAELVGTLEYPDHHRYTAADWQVIVDTARNADLTVTTEKDLVKLERFPFARDSLYALRLEVTMAAEDARKLDELIIGPAGAARAAAHG